jgi:hypothetical protein
MTELYSGALSDVIDPPRDKFDINSDKDSAKCRDSDDGAYHPRPAQRRLNRGEVVDSSEESDSSSDGDKKPRAQLKKKKSSKKSAPVKKEKCQGESCPGHIVPCLSVLWMTAPSSFIGSVTRSNLANLQLPELPSENLYSATFGIMTSSSRPIPRWS